MAFCTSCGNEVGPSEAFCTKCGARMAGAQAVSSGAVGAQPGTVQQGKSNVLKYVLIAFAVLLVLAFAATAGIVYLVKRAANSAIEHSSDGKQVTINTPMGSLTANTDAKKVVQDLAVPEYPGSKLEENGASSASVGNLVTHTAQFETSDPFDKVAEFYTAKFPNATVTKDDETQSAVIISGSKDDLITINVDGGEQGVVRIGITRAQRR